MKAHGSWSAELAGQPSQKTFRVAEGNDVVEIVLTIFSDAPTAGADMPAEDVATAGPGGGP